MSYGFEPQFWLKIRIKEKRKKKVVQRKKKREKGFNGDGSLPLNQITDIDN